MDKIISLYGKYRGMVRIRGEAGAVTADIKGAPADAVLYIIDGASARRFDGSIRSEVMGALVCKENSDTLYILMEGTARGAKPDMDAIKRNLKQEYAKDMRERTQPNAFAAPSANRTCESEARQSPVMLSDMKSEAGKAVAQTASLLFGENAKRLEKKPEQRGGAYNPFPDAFPDSVWKKVRYQGTNRHYLECHTKIGGINVVIHGIVGELHDSPSAHKGFESFMRSTDGVGYWLRIRQE